MLNEILEYNLYYFLIFFSLKSNEHRHQDAGFQLSNEKINPK